MKALDAWKEGHIRDVELLSQCRDAIKAVAPGAEVVLYGSRARGDASPESDYDLLVLVDGPVDRDLENRIGDRLYDLELETGSVVSLIVYEKSFWETSLCKAMPLHRNVDREGVKL